MPRTVFIEEPNLGAFLDMVAHSELGQAILEQSDDGYNVLVGSMPGNVQTFDSYDDHPRIKVPLPRLKISSTAAGRYQILARFWDSYKGKLQLDDFSPENQDKYAVQQIRERRALILIQEGKIEEAITRCSNIWASLPGAGYGQHENSVEHLIAAYQSAGGEVA